MNCAWKAAKCNLNVETLHGRALQNGKLTVTSSSSQKSKGEFTLTERRK